MTPKLLNNPSLSGGDPILSLGKRPYSVSGQTALSYLWTGRMQAAHAREKHSS